MALRTETKLEFCSREILFFSEQFRPELKGPRCGLAGANDVD
jgi:hypothetical protein